MHGIDNLMKMENGRHDDDVMTFMRHCHDRHHQLKITINKGRGERRG